MKLILTSLLIFIFLFLPGNTYAQIGLKRDQAPVGIIVPAGGGSGNALGNLVNNTITIFFSVGALGFVVMFLWGAVNWILSGGDKEKIAGARKRITTAIVGLVLLSLTFVIMIVIGQILGIKALHQFDFRIPGLLQK